VNPSLAGALAALLSGVALQPLLIPWLRRLGVMDVPNHRSSHVEVTPRGGGIAVLAALGVGLVVAQVGAPAWITFAGCLMLAAIGLVDDFGEVDAKVRLTALLLVGAGAGGLLESPLPLVLAIPFMAAWTAAYVNAFNFMDGINGISALTGIVAGGAYVAIGTAYDSAALVALGAALLGACLSFLPFNLPRARVFLGDVGSYGVGFVIAACAWLAWGAGVPLLLAVSPTVIYLADTGWTLLRRARSGAPLMEAHREHTYQLLVAGGRSHTQVSLVVAGASGAIVLLAWAGAERDLGGGIIATLVAAVVVGGYLGAASRVVRSQV
jgi:UDP-GlcNAc:undecaprenyl-phosphate GlcNAc-1-phosphate transferase